MTLRIAFIRSILRDGVKLQGNRLCRRFEVENYHSERTNSPLLRIRDWSVFEELFLLFLFLLTREISNQEI